MKYKFSEQHEYNSLLYRILTAYVLLTALCFGGESGIIDSVLLVNVPRDCRLNLEENFTDSSGRLSSSRLTMYLKNNGGVTAVKYTNTFTKQKPFAVLENFDIWTLDQDAGRVRRIPFYKKKEKINGTNLTYWDLFPHLLVYYKRRLISNTLMPDGSREIRIAPQKFLEYGEIRLICRGTDLLLQKIMLYSYYGRLVKELNFEMETDRFFYTFPFRKISIKHVNTNTRTELVVLSVEELSAFPKLMPENPVRIKELNSEKITPGASPASEPDMVQE